MGTQRKQIRALEIDKNSLRKHRNELLGQLRGLAHDNLRLVKELEDERCGHAAAGDLRDKLGEEVGKLREQNHLLASEVVRLGGSITSG